LKPSLEKISSFLQQQDYESEVLVVENGSTDATLEIAQSQMKMMPDLRVLTLSERGKGLAVKAGMLEAKGQYRFMCDADLSMPIEQISRFLPPALNLVDIAIGSREAAGARRFDEPMTRHIIGRVFNAIVHWIILPGIQDTQCGFKCFSERTAQAVFPLQTLNGMSFDAEVLFIASQKGFKIQEIPIDWYFNSDSRVRLVKDSLRMFLDLLTIRRQSRRGLYES
jgi:dolichyl-phosphate beta-glucosyltransferase